MFKDKEVKVMLDHAKYPVSNYKVRHLKLIA
jgi:hypothetical protein